MQSVDIALLFAFVFGASIGVIAIIKEIVEYVRTRPPKNFRYIGDDKDNKDSHYLRDDTGVHKTPRSEYLVSSE